jgi:tRNA (cmo5U34)-methyltransferase
MTDAISAFAARATHYDAERRQMVPCFEQLYGTAVRLLTLREGPVERVLDLGAGTGLMSEAVLARHPDVELVLLDGSAEMLERARERLPESATMVVGDLRGPLPNGPFDAVVSSLAIHHLEPEEQRALYGRIPALLRPGGVFVNAEHIAGATPWLESANRTLWREAAVGAGAGEQMLAQADDRMGLNRCVSVADQISWLADAGLNDGACFFSLLYFAVLAGWRL